MTATIFSTKTTASVTIAIATSVRFSIHHSSRRKTIRMITIFVFTDSSLVKVGVFFGGVNVKQQKEMLAEHEIAKNKRCEII